MRSPLAHDGHFWRRLARLGAQRGPEWWVRYSPPIFGWAAALAVPAARRAVLRNLRLLRGPAHPFRDAVDTARTFATYAGCLAETLSAGSKNGRVPREIVRGKEHIDSAFARKKGVLVVTVHSGGWELVGPLFAGHYDVEILLAMEPERDAEARDLHDEARQTKGVRVVHVGKDPLSSLPLLRHLQQGGIVAMQVDRVPTGMRSRTVRLLGRESAIPEGPLRLAQLSGAPVVPIFCARSGYRSYVVEVHPGIFISRRASPEDLDAAAQHVADSMTQFLKANPTQWFHFDEALAAPPGPSAGDDQS